MGADSRRAGSNISLQSVFLERKGKVVTKLKLNARDNPSLNAKDAEEILCVPLRFPLHPLRLDLIRSFLILLPARDSQESLRRVREDGAFSIDQMHPSLQFHFPHRQSG